MMEELEILIILVEAVVVWVQLVIRQLHLEVEMVEMV